MRCVVTGSSGFVGRRLVEMLLERGATHVVAFDIVPAPSDAPVSPRITYVTGDIRDFAQVSKAIEGADCVWHNAAAVGPYHPLELYEAVNHQGTLHVIEACLAHGVGKCVMSSSPSTRFDGSDVDGLTCDELPKLPLASYVQEYAESKARGEMAMLAANCDAFMTCAIAPHQVYGPRDNIFLPNLLEAAGTGMLRVFGNGQNRICFTHVDNYCHGLIIAEKALKPGSKVCGRFYIVTDAETHPYEEGYHLVYDALDEAVLAMGFPSIKAKIALPYWLLMGVAYVLAAVTAITGWTFKLTPFTVLMLTMHRWFRIDDAKEDLGYEPIVSFKDAWPETLVWFRENWLPNFQSKKEGLVGLSKQTQDRIDIQKGL